MRYYLIVIESIGDKDTERIWRREFVKRLPNDVQRLAYRKLVVTHRSKDLTDLRVPPGNMLEALSGDRNGQYSIRINRQWRICFRWTRGVASDVEIVDYH